jgi:CRP/FNR family transcriptional regulator, cyclic AMP receptor protein
MKSKQTTHERHKMTCRCKQIAENGIALSPTCIGHLWIFQNLASEDIEALSRKALRKKAIKGQPLFLQGDLADEMFLIKGGRIKLTKIIEDGTELMLDIRESGDFVGETMFFGKGRYPISAVCLEETLTCGFTRSQFEELVRQHPAVGLQVNKTIRERIPWLKGRAGTLAVVCFEDRLHRVRGNLAQNEHGAQNPHGEVIQFPLTN